jgi:hypothetical protein
VLISYFKESFPQNTFLWYDLSYTRNRAVTSCNQFFLSKLVTSGSDSHTYAPMEDTSSAPALVPASPLTTRWRRIPPLYRQLVYAAPSTIAWLSWLTMLIFFLASYMTLRDSNGHIPRISFHYSTFPYISCIGALHAVYFRMTCILVASCVITSFILDYHFGKTIDAGRIWRQVKVFWGILASGFLVAMSFASINDGGNLHLIFASVHIWTAVCAKICDFVSGILMRKVNKTNPHLILAKKWKKVVGFIGARKIIFHIVHQLSV